jgi:hypothetical protein
VNNNSPRKQRPSTFGERFRRRLSVIGHGLYLDLNRDHRRTVLLTGSGRSGTTWVVGVANFDHYYRVMIEPFHRGNVPAVKAFARRQYLRADSNDPAYLGPATAIFTGAIRDAWVDGLNKPGIYSNRIAKDVRTMLMLGWVRAHFPGMPIVMLLRHPCAVASSRTQLGWEDIREDYLTQQDLIADHLAPFAAAIRAARGDFERHVFDWCVENYVPFRTFARGDVHLAFYENFCVDPNKELERLFTFLGRPFDDRVIASLKTPSVQAHAVGRPRPSAIFSGESLTESWRKHVAPAEVKRAYEIVESFGLEKIYGRSSMPDIAGAEMTFSGRANAAVKAPV